MKLVACSIHALAIPFVEAFRHSLKDRTSCDSVIVHVVDDAGNEGYGEGAPRPYVTGERQDSMVEHLARDLWPAVKERLFPPIHEPADLAALDAFIPERPFPNALSDNASRAALELAILDRALRRDGRGAAALLPPRRDKVVYSGVITAGTIEKALQHAKQMRMIGLAQVKVKVGFPDDLERVAAVREALGPDASIRLDANGAWAVGEAAERLAALSLHRIDAVEQPIPRGPVEDLARLKSLQPVPIMADESLVTIADARALAAARAVDLFNIRVSKCGGLFRSMEIARIAECAGIRVQVGAQVGETAILSAAGRHLAAAVPNLAFAEGSFGTLLLSDDLARDAVRFGYRGEARLLSGPGFGARIVMEHVRKWSARTIEV